MQYVPPYYFSHTGGITEGPFCQPCWDEKKIESPLQTRRQGAWTCYVCKKSFFDGNYVPDPPKPMRARRSTFG
jgi:ribosomal protein L37AE/L43A